MKLHTGTYYFVVTVFREFMIVCVSLFYSFCKWGQCAMWLILLTVGVTSVKNSMYIHCTCPNTNGIPVNVENYFTITTSPHLIWGHMSHVSYPHSTIHQSHPPYTRTQTATFCTRKKLDVLPFFAPSISTFTVQEEQVNVPSHHASLAKKSKGAKTSLLHCALCLSTMLGFSPFLGGFRLQRCVSAPRSSQEPNPCTSQQNVTS